MPASLLESQFAALEEPDAQDAIVVPVEIPPEEAAARIERAMN
jgi:gluconate kinase